MRPEPLIVVGAGIGGIATALSLSQKGYSSLVLEKSSRLSEIGAGIQLGPNAFNALERLGVTEELREKSVFIENLRLIDAVSGEEVATIPLGNDFRRRFRNPYAVIHRGELHSALLRRCRAMREFIDLRVDTTIVDVEQGDAGVFAVTQSGERIQGAALVGCDGLWSRVRERIVGDGPPRISGHSTYRSVIQFKDMPEDLRINAATLWAGPKCHIVHYPLSGGKLFNLVVTYHNHATEPVAGRSVGAEEVRRGFEGVSPRIKRVIDSSEDWRLWVLCDRDPAERWASGRITLLGDAAHPMLQYFAQGACMALEDAVCIGEAVAAARGDFEAAFHIYQDARVLRTARVQLQSRAIGEFIYHPGGVAARLRNSIMRSKSSEEWYHSLDWLYGYDISLPSDGISEKPGACSELQGVRGK